MAGDGSSSEGCEGGVKRCGRAVEMPLLGRTTRSNQQCGDILDAVDGAAEERVELAVGARMGTLLLDGIKQVRGRRWLVESLDDHRLCPPNQWRGERAGLLSGNHLRRVRGMRVA